MTLTFSAINAVAQATVWLAVICLAVWLVRKDSPGPTGVWRSLLLRIGLAGLPVILLLGAVEHLLPYARPLWRVAPAASEAKNDAEAPGRGDNAENFKSSGIKSEDRLRKSMILRVSASPR